MGYRSSMPIIELKLTGPASEQQAMEKLLTETLKRVPDGVISKAPKDCPRRSVANYKTASSA